MGFERTNPAAVSRAEAASAHHSVKALYETHFHRLVGHLRSTFGAGPPEPEDIAQRAFENIFARGDLRDIENPAGFVWRIARNIAISEKRALKVRERHAAETAMHFPGPDGYLLTPERVLDGKEHVAIANEALRNMPEQRRRAFILTRIEGLSHAEAARRLGVSRPAVTKHVARAAADLYSALTS